MSLAVALLALGMSAVATPTITRDRSPELSALCRTMRPQLAQDDPADPRIDQPAPSALTPLTRLPPAAQHMAVIRKVGGCDVATVRWEGRLYWVPLPESRGVQPVPSSERILRHGHPAPRPAP